MNPLSREDLFSLEKYAEQRAAFRAQVLAHKKHRRVDVGPNLCPSATAPVVAAPATPAAPAPAAGPSGDQPPSATPAPTPPAAAEPTPPATEPAPAPSQPVADATALLSISFSGVSWIEVTDANGKVLLSQLAREGDVLEPAGGTLPLSVVIGDASKATVSVRGGPFNLEPVKRANVARFSVK